MIHPWHNRIVASRVLFMFPRPGRFEGGPVERPGDVLNYDHDTNDTNRTNEAMSIGTQSAVLPDLGRDRTATLKQQVGRRIHNARVRAGISQTQLAAAIGTSQSTIYCIENGHEGLRVDRLFAIARECGVATSSLIDGLG